MTTPDAARRELRRLLPEFAAVIEEYRQMWGQPLRAREVPPTYGETILTIVSPMLVSYAEALRSGFLDTIDDEEALSVWAVVSPVVEVRRQRRAEYERRHPGAQ